MWQKIFLTISLLVSGLVFSQQAAKTSAIAMEFSAPSIAAYQESSQTKVIDFYQYLTLLTEPGYTKELKTQIKESIYQQFGGKQIELIDFTTEDPAKINLPQLLEKVSQLPKTTFTVVENHSSQVNFNEFWLNSYTLQIQTGTEKTTKTLQQKIYFHPQQKEFGNTNKEVWSLRLGEVERVLIH